MLPTIAVLLLALLGAFVKVHIAAGL